MKVEGTHTFDAPRDVVWPMLRDPEVLARILPGCESLEQVAEDRYQGVLKIKIGPVQGTFDGTIEVTDIQEPERATITVTGQGAPGFMNGTGHLVLEEADGSSVLTYDGDAQVGGRLASVGQRLIDSSSKAIIKQGLEALDAQVHAVSHPAASNGDQAQTPPPEAPSDAAFAVGVARNMIEDALEETDREELVKTVAIGAGLILILYLLYRWTR